MYYQSHQLTLSPRPRDYQAVWYLTNYLLGHYVVDICNRVLGAQGQKPSYPSPIFSGQFTLTGQVGPYLYAVISYNRLYNASYTICNLQYTRYSLFQHQSLLNIHTHGKFFVDFRDRLLFGPLWDSMPSLPLLRQPLDNTLNLITTRDASGPSGPSTILTSLVKTQSMGVRTEPRQVE